jgi:hypothetical protein
MPLDTSDGKRTAERFEASSRTDRPHTPARGSVPHDVTVSGALFGVVSDDAFAEPQLTRGSVLVPRGPNG